MAHPQFQPQEFPADEPAAEVLRTRWARLPYSLLILGEIGTGKTVLARRLHQLSSRGQREPVVCSMAELAEGLSESRLFGHVRGAYTDAIGERKGIFERAHLSTLILDEIGKATLPVQGALLRAIDEKRVERLGAEREIAVDVRLIAATNCDLDAMVEAGTFLDDLLSRLGYYVIRLAPLRDEPWRIRGLAETFLKAEAPVVGRERAPRLSGDVEKLLVAAPWRRNVRELHNVCRYLAGNAGETATASDLPPDFLRTLGVDPKRADEPMEARIRRILAEEHGNKSRAARRLRISRSQLYRLLNDKSPGRESSR